MKMDTLWAPWRIKYIESALKKKNKCIFCEALKAKNNDSDYVVFKTKHSFALLNIFPYNNGHMMVAPLKHTRDLSYLSDGQTMDLMKAIAKARGLLDKVLKPHGYNIGINISRSAGAGIPGHLHVHIVPRWIGDANFMPTTAGTKVLSQSLEELYKQLKDAQSKTNKRIRR